MFICHVDWSLVRVYVWREKSLVSFYNIGDIAFSFKNSEFSQIYFQSAFMSKTQDT